MNNSKVSIGGQEIKGINNLSLPKIIPDELFAGEMVHFDGVFRTNDTITALCDENDILWKAANHIEVEVGQSLMMEATYRNREERMELKCIEKNQRGYKFEVIN